VKERSAAHLPYGVGNVLSELLQHQ